MVAREKPHWGVSGVPFMKRTTGAEAMALSIAARVSSERRRAWRGESIRGAAKMLLEVNRGTAERAAARDVVCSESQLAEYSKFLDWSLQRREFSKTW